MPGKSPATRETTRSRRAVAGATKEVPPSADNGAVPGEQTTLQGSLRSLQQENRTLRLLVAIHDRLGSLVLEGTPKEATPAYQKVLLYVDAQTNQVRRVLILDAQGNRNRFDFSAPVVNQPVAKTDFEFTAPAGTRVIKP